MTDATHMFTDKLQDRISSRHELPTKADPLPCTGLVSEFGEEFAVAMRLETALRPNSLEVSDVVDVFSDTGSFLFRGVVEERNGAFALVKVTNPLDSREGVTKHEVSIEHCRYADASSPPATLREWEAARDADSSNPPL